MSRYKPNRHHRRSIRLREYDYAQPGAYFVTIVTHHHELRFDDPILCRVAETMWQRIPHHFPFVQLDECIVMPNHIHGILVIVDRGCRGDAFPVDRLATSRPSPAGPPDVLRPDWEECVAPTSGPTSSSLGAIVGNFKSVTARRINRIRKTPGTSVWQRNYYERVIRNEREWDAIRQYIRDNPAHWAEDQENPNRRT
jgi:REP element-mobilizing transposase RayT